MGSKEIPTSVGDGEGAIDERVSANQSKSIDLKMIQQIRAIKVTKERMHIKKEMMNGKPSKPKSFRVSNSESKFLAIKQIIEAIKSDKSELMIKGKIDINASGLKNENEGTNLRFKNNSGK